MRGSFLCPDNKVRQVGAGPGNGANDMLPCREEGRGAVMNRYETMQLIQSKAGPFLERLSGTSIVSTGPVTTVYDFPTLQEPCVEQ